MFVQLQERQGAAAGADLAKAVSEFEKVAVVRQTVDLIDGIAPPPTGSIGFAVCVACCCALTRCNVLFLR